MKLELAPKIRDLFFEPTPHGPPRYIPSRYKVAYGGRGSTKSWGFADVAVMLMAARKVRVMCARELQNSIQESVHRLLSDKIEQHGMLPYFNIQQTSITSVTGSEVILNGIRNNPTKIKSTEGVDICWVEEAEKVSARSWEILIPTIRKPGSEIWATFNPDEETDPTYQRFVVNQPDNSRIIKIDWRDNPWFPEELRAEKDYMMRVDMDAYYHVWEGHPRKNSDAQVLRGRCTVHAFEPDAGWQGPYYGADWGFSVDPTTLIRMWVNGTRLYIEHEVYKVGVDIDKIPTLFDKVPDSRTYLCRADNARPETISYMQRHGFPRMCAATKWSGSVEDGVERLRSFEEIVIHPRCTKTAEEAKLWSYKVDRTTGDVLPELVDKHNHCWDAIRYGLEPLIRKRNRAHKKRIQIMGR